MKRSRILSLVVLALGLVFVSAAYCGDGAAMLELVKKQIAALADPKSPFESMNVHLDGGAKYSFGDGCSFEIDTNAGALIVRDEKVKGVPQYVFPFDHIVAICLMTEDDDD